MFDLQGMRLKIVAENDHQGYRYFDVGACCNYFEING